MNCRVIIGFIWIDSLGMKSIINASLVTLFSFLYEPSSSSGSRCFSVLCDI